MPKFTVWRSGSGHVNCWNPLPYNCGEFEADTFIDACKEAIKILCNPECWSVEVVDGVMFIESNETHRFGHRVGRYGLYPNEEDAMEETRRRFDREHNEEFMRLMCLDTGPTKLSCWERFVIPQKLYANKNQTFTANVCLEKWEFITWGNGDINSDLVAHQNYLMLNTCIGCPNLCTNSSCD